MGECFEVDLEEPISYEVPALFLTVLGWPGPKEADSRPDLYESIAVWLIQHRCVTDPAWARQQIPIMPAALLTISERERQRDLRTLERRLKDRLTAGYMAVAFLKEAESGTPTELPEGVERLSVNQLAAAVAADRGIADPENLETRIWRPSLPVLHLCAAWTVCIQECQRETGREPSIGDLYAQPGFLALVLTRAALFEGLLQKSQLQIDPETLIRFRPPGRVAS